MAYLTHSESQVADDSFHAWFPSQVETAAGFRVLAFEATLFGDKAVRL